MLLLTYAMLLSFFVHPPLHLVGCRYPQLTTFEVLKTTLIWLRALSVSLYTIWIWAILLNYQIIILPSHLLGWFVGVPLLSIGQYLNYKVYKVLGIKKVYYGYEFGVVPPDTEQIITFPYNVMSHPQYIGCMMSIFGTFIIWGITSEYIIKPMALETCLLLMSTYGLSMMIETPWKKVLKIQ